MADQKIPGILLFSRPSLGNRLALVLLPLVLVPLILLGSAAYFRSRTILQTQATTQLTSAASGQIETLQAWSETREQRLQLGSQRSGLRSAVGQLIAGEDPQGEALNAARGELADLRIRQGVVLFSEVLVARLNDGRILASTEPDWEGQVLAAIVEGELTGDSLTTWPFYSLTPLAPENVVFLSIAPMRADSESVDVLLIGANLDLRLAALMEEIQAFWEERGAYVIQRGGTFLALEPDIIVELPRYSMDLSTTTMVDHPVFQLATGSPAGSAQYINREGIEVLAAYEWIPESNMGVVVELPQEEVFADLATLAPFTIALIGGATALTILVVLLVTRRMLQPLSQFTESAERISQGDLDVAVPETREDELGTLAKAFNAMANQVRDLVTGLEGRVTERTLELEKRAVQVQTAAEVARDISGVRDITRMLEQTVLLISERFGYYQVGVFLLDDSGDYAVLRAASSEGGRRMLTRGHRLEVGKVGIVGYVTGTGKPRIALDVGKDAVHFANPDLPLTRSEMALPLKLGERILGALDVQSEEPNAFDEGDITILQTMADQLALAIQNVRLIESQTRLAAQRRQVIEISQELSERRSFDSLRTEATRIIQRTMGFTRVTLGLVDGSEIIVRSSAAAPQFQPVPVGAYFPIGRGVLGQTVSGKSSVVVEGPSTYPQRTPAGEKDLVVTTISAPLYGREGVMGALAVESPTSIGSPEPDVETVQLLADQVASALERSELFEETQRSLEQLDSLYRQRVSEAWAQIHSRYGIEEAEIAEYISHPEYRDVEGDQIKAPISLRGEVIGELLLQGSKPDEWSREDEVILAEVAEEVGEALEQIRLMEESRRRAAQLQTASEIARDAAGLLDLDTLLHRGVNLIQERFNLYNVSAYLHEEPGGSLTIQASTGEAGQIMMDRGYTLEVGSRTVAGYVAERGQHYIAEDEANPLFHRNPLLPEAKSELGIPLKIGDRVIGVLSVVHDQPNPFSRDDVSVLSILADQMATAIQNAILFAEAQSQAQREKTVVDIGSKIRSSEDIQSMLRTAVEEMKTALGARDARLHLKPSVEEPKVEEGGDGREGDLTGQSRKRAQDEVSQ